MVSFTHQKLYPGGKEPQYPLDRRLGGPQSRAGRGGEEKNSQLPPGIEPPNSVASSYTDWAVPRAFNWAPRHEGVLEEWKYSSTTPRERAPGTHCIGGYCTNSNRNAINSF